MITVLFTDIRDFTKKVESMEVSSVVDFLNMYYCFALPVIPQCGAHSPFCTFCPHIRLISNHHLFGIQTIGGFVDKFIGDSIMCVFAHDNSKKGAEDSVRCAIKMLQALDYMNQLHGFDSYKCETGIGINSGRCIMCVVGTESRMEPTVLGDDVNLASRTESLCKKYKARILITEATKAEICGGGGEDLFFMRQVDFCRPLGKVKPVKIFEVIDGDAEPTKTKKTSLLNDWARGLQQFEEKDLVGAIESFEVCLSRFLCASCMHPPRVD
jgi:adenylate cyclase